MNWNEVLPYVVGGSAWLSPVLYDALKSLRKPRILLFPQELLLITNPRGQLSLLMTCTIDTEIKDALLTDMKIELKHRTKGTTIELKWVGFREVTHHAAPPTGASVEFYKETWQPAVIKIVTSDVWHAQVTFEDVEYRDNTVPLIDNLVNRIQDRIGISKNIKKEIIISQLDDLKSTDSYRKLRTLYDNSLPEVQ